MKPMIVSSVAAIALLSMTGCGSAPDRTAQQAAVPPATVNQFVAPGMVGQKVTVEAVVEAVDLATRQVTLRGSQGNLETVTVGEDVRNLPQLRVGDRVVTEYFQGLAVSLAPSDGGIRRRVETTTGQRAALGQRPGGMVMQTVEIDARVEAVDPQARTVTLRGPRRTVKLEVANDIDLNQIKTGDLVHAVYQEALAISVRPAGQ